MGGNESWSRVFFKKFRTKLIVLVFLTLVPAFALVLQRNFDQRRTEKERVVERIRGVSRLLAASQSGYVKNTRQLLSTLSGLDFLVLATNEPFCRVHFQNLLKLAPDYINFGLLETNGAVFSSAIVPEGPMPSLADRSYFQRTLKSRGFSIGQFQIGRLSNEKSVNFAFPINDTSGQLVRVLFASLKLDRFTETARHVGLPLGAVATVLDLGGTVLARVPDSDGWVGRTVPDMAFVRDVLRVQEGTIESTGLDGVRRVYALTPIADDTSASLFIAVGVPTSVLFAKANSALTRNIIGATVIILVALWVSSIFAGRVFVRPIRDLSEAAHRLAEGDLSARTDERTSTIEVRKLANAFNSMAARLQQRSAEVERAKCEIQKMNAELEKKVQERTSELSAANQELEAFSYSVSHDLRAPLRHLDGFTELLKQGQKERLDEKGKRQLEVIGQAAKKMGTLIDELLIFSRMGRQEMLRTSVPMRTVVSEALEHLEQAYANRQVELIISDMRQVEADPAMMRLVWVNLISNALKYSGTRERARIEIDSYDTPTEQVFFIRDNGVGFDMKYADKLFGVFQRLHSEREFEGTGIGLANVRRIVSRHGGRTWAESVLGEGSTFYFSLLHYGKST
jgi:signal transduction histidine kinase